MSPLVPNNKALQFRNSYAKLFKVAQHNLTLWLIEENVARIEKQQNFLTKQPSYHKQPHVPTGANSRQ
jgi:phage antirepressor YoqD-like protein